MDESGKNKLIDEILGVSDTRNPDVIDIDISFRQYQNIDQTYAFIDKWKGLSTKELVGKSILDPAFRKEASVVLESLGYSSDPRFLSESLVDIFGAAANPTGDMLRNMQRMSGYGLSGPGQQVAEEGLYAGIRGRSIQYQGQGGSGGRFIGVLGKWDKDKIIEEITTGKTGYISFINLNGLDETRMTAAFDRLGVASVGARADHPDLHSYEMRAARIVESDPAKNQRERIFGEFVSTISPQQRMAMTSELTLPEKMFVFDTESIWGTEMMKNLVKNAEDLAGMGSGIDKEKIAAYVRTIDDPKKKAAFIREFMQGERTGVITEAYGVKVDATAMLRGEAELPVVQRTASGALDELRFARGKTADETIESLYGFLTGIEKVHQDGWRLTGENVLRHDIPMMGYFGAMLHEYYNATGDTEKASDMLRIGGQFDDYGGIKMKATTFTNRILTGDSSELAIDLLGYHRLFAPTLSKDGAWYLGQRSADEDELFSKLSEEGKTKSEITEEIANQRARKIALEETGGQGQKLKTILDRHTTYSSAAVDIEELFGGGDTLLEREFLDRLDPHIESVESLFNQYKTAPEKFSGEDFERSFFERRYEELNNIFKSSYVAMDRQRVEKYWAMRLNKEQIMKSMGVTEEEFGTMLGKAHGARPDALLSIAFFGQDVQRFRSTGELAMIPINISPEMAWKVNLWSTNYLSKLAEGKITEVRGLDDINAKLFDDATTEEAISFIARRNRAYSFATMEHKTSLLDDVVNIVAGEGTFSDKAKDTWNAAVKVANESHRAVNDDAISLLMRLNKDMTVIDATNKINRTMKGQRYAIAGIAAIIGLNAVTNKMRSKSTSNEAWDKSPTMDPEEYQRRQRELKYQEEMSQMGNLPLESSNRRNYSYNMRNDRHDHLFRE